MSSAITQLPANIVDSSKVSGWDKVFQDELAKCFPLMDTKGWDIQFAYRHNLESPCAGRRSLPPGRRLLRGLLRSASPHLVQRVRECHEAGAGQADGGGRRLFYPDVRIPVSRRETEQEVGHGS